MVYRELMAQMEPMVHLVLMVRPERMESLVWMALPGLTVNQDHKENPDHPGPQAVENLKTYHKINGGIILMFR
jgi:hypothetical protein